MIRTFFWHRDTADKEPLETLSLWFQETLSQIQYPDLSKPVDLRFFTKDGAFWLCEDNDPLSITADLLFRHGRYDEMLARSLDEKCRRADRSSTDPKSCKAWKAEVWSATVQMTLLEAPRDYYDELSNVLDQHPIGMPGVRR